MSSSPSFAAPLGEGTKEALTNSAGTESQDFFPAPHSLNAANPLHQALMRFGNTLKSKRKPRLAARPVFRNSVYKFVRLKGPVARADSCRTCIDSTPNVPPKCYRLYDKNLSCAQWPETQHRGAVRSRRDENRSMQLWKSKAHPGVYRVHREEMIMAKKTKTKSTKKRNEEYGWEQHTSSEFFTLAQAERFHR